MNRIPILSKRSRRSVFALVLVIIVSVAVPLFADGFGSNSNFAPPEETHAFQTPETASAANTACFIHQQPIKIGSLLVFTAFAEGIIVTRRYELRRWVLLLSVIVLGFVMGGFLCATTTVQNEILKFNLRFPVVLPQVSPISLSLYRRGSG